jgi:Predicted divalent heavy-metal cations transporter
MVGAITLLLPPRRLQQLLLPLVSLAAGSLLGGALFHMLPEGMEAMPSRSGSLCIAAGFMTFLALEQFLQWHHSHRHAARSGPDAAAGGASRKPMAILILLGDALHNFIGGLGIASTFLLNPAAGVAAFVAAVAHEVPQELGDFAILVHSGWERPHRPALELHLSTHLPAGSGARLADLPVAARGGPCAVRLRQLPLHRGLGSGAGDQGRPQLARRRPSDSDGAARVCWR